MHMRKISDHTKSLKIKGSRMERDSLWCERLQVKKWGTHTHRM